MYVCMSVNFSHETNPESAHLGYTGVPGIPPTQEAYTPPIWRICIPWFPKLWVRWEGFKTKGHKGGQKQKLSF